MQNHQKFFPVTDPNGRLLPNFITIANITSNNPDKVRAGNERVIRLARRRRGFLGSGSQRFPPAVLPNRQHDLSAATCPRDKQRRVTELDGHIAGFASYDVEGATCSILVQA
jgi:glycyl-tRNA synthetase beta chain